MAATPAAEQLEPLEPKWSKMAWAKTVCLSSWPQFNSSSHWSYEHVFNPGLCMLASLLLVTYQNWWATGLSLDMLEKKLWSDTGLLSNVKLEKGKYTAVETVAFPAKNGITIFRQHTVIREFLSNLRIRPLAYLAEGVVPCQANQSANMVLVIVLRSVFNTELLVFLVDLGFWHNAVI